MSRRMYRHTRRPPSRVVRSESRARKQQEQNRLRLVSVAACFAFSFFAVSMRLVEVSLVGGGELPFKRLVTEPQLMLQMDEKEKDAGLNAVQEMPRRDIVDRNGVVLATNIETASLVANPSLIRNPRQVASQLARQLTSVPEKALLDKLSKQDTRFVYLKRNLTPAEQEKVNALGVPGLFFERHDRRVYPFGAMMAHTVGTVDIDNKGASGIEQFFDKKLGHAVGAKEPLKLSLDARIQSVLYNELMQSMKKFSAIGATGIVMDVKTGELVAMVSLPSFDPHEPALASEEARFNRATLGTYEMGSTFKTFTVAMALDNGTVGMHDGYDASQPIRMSGFTIHDYHPYYRWLSVPEIYAYSSNIGTVRMAMDVGMKRQREFLKSVGMMEPVSVELPERAQPQVPTEWKEITAMTISYGHGMSVTPLHLAQGISAMVNGGEMHKPTLLARKDGEPVENKQVISERTSSNIRKLMRTVVQYGTAKKADVAGYQVGGKTGTAEKIENGHYKDKATLSSLVSVFPTNNPRYLVYAMLDEPKGTKDTYGYSTGGWVAAPVVANTVVRMANILGIAPQMEAPDPQEARFWEEAELRNKQAKERHIQVRAIHAASY